MGSGVVDVYVRTDPDESELVKICHGKKETVLHELVAFPTGGKILIKDIDFMIGGGGTNTAVSFSRLGFNTGFVGKLGKDENGAKIFNLLKKEHIHYLGKLGDTTGYSIVLDAIGNDRTILTYKGCNDDLLFSELHKSKLKAKAYYLCSMLGKSFKTLEKIAEHAKQNKSLVAFNPSSYLTKKGTNTIKKILANTDILILNRSEAHDLVGCLHDLKLGAKRLQALGPKTVIITNGNKGIAALQNKTYYETKPRKVKVLETTGAGDAFGSTFVAAQLMKKTMKDSLKMAMINAESVISHYGAKNTLLTKSTLSKKLTKDKRTIKGESIVKKH